MATPTVKENHKLYGGKVSIDFYPVKHAYKIPGNRTWLVGVTTACNQKDKSGGLLRWAERLTRAYLFDILNKKKVITQADILDAIDQRNITLDKASEIGTQIHDWIKDYIAGKNPTAPDDEKVQNGVVAFLDWEAKHKVKWLESERLCFSKKYGYVGTFDAIAEINGKLYMVDFKSSKGLYLTMRYQTAAYTKAWNEEFPDKKIVNRYILKLGKDDGEFKAVAFENEQQLEEDFQGFLACLTLKNHDKQEYKWQREINL